MLKYPLFEPFFSINEKRNLYHQRCEAIHKQLKNKCIQADVSRHHLKDKLYYDLEIHNETHISEKDVASALKIPKDWVDFIHIDTEHHIIIYWIDEVLLNKKYLNRDGEMDFNYYDRLKQRVKDYIDNPEIRVAKIEKGCGEITIEMRYLE